MWVQVRGEEVGLVNDDAPSRSPPFPDKSGGLSVNDPTPDPPAGVLAVVQRLNERFSFWVTLPTLCKGFVERIYAHI